MRHLWDCMSPSSLPGHSSALALGQNQERDHQTFAERRQVLQRDWGTDFQNAFKKPWRQTKCISNLLKWISPRLLWQEEKGKAIRMRLVDSLKGNESCWERGETEIRWNEALWKTQDPWRLIRNLGGMRESIARMRKLIAIWMKRVRVPSQGIYWKATDILNAAAASQQQQARFDGSSSRWQQRKSAIKPLNEERPIVLRIPKPQLILIESHSAWRVWEMALAALRWV